MEALQNVLKHVFVMLYMYIFHFVPDFKKATANTDETKHISPI